MKPIKNKYAITYYSVFTGYNMIYFDHLPTAPELYFLADDLNVKSVRLWENIDGEFELLSELI